MSLFKLRRRKQPYSSLDLSDELVQTWHDDGFVLIPGAVEQSVVEAINAEVQHYSGAERRVSGTNITVDVLHGRFGGKLMRLCDAPDEIFAGPVKINQLFTESAAVRLGTYAPAVIKTLGGLLGEAPVAINSLNFVYGSQQPAHVDSWYMPPPKGAGLAVSSLYLDEMNDRNGPLFYYPGSHRIEPYRFSHGRWDAVADEMDACRAYFERELERRGISRVLVHAKPGDVVFWHCHLLHGGAPIVSLSATRRALVTHYWGQSCLSHKELGDFGGKRYYQLRDYTHYDYTPPTDDPANTSQIELPDGEQATLASRRQSHASFEVWDIETESLEQVENRIHDGVPRDQLHWRAEVYLKTFERLFPNTKPEAGARMMEIGSGVAYVMQAAQTRYQPARMIGLDVAPGMIEMAKQRLERDAVDQDRIDFVVYDGRDVPMPDASLDFVYSVAAMQHVPRQYFFQVLLETVRLLAPGGRAWFHLLAVSHFCDHVTPEQFAHETAQQVRERAGHWHHYYSVEEIEAVVRYGLGLPDAEVKELSGSLYLVFHKPSD